jgi:hypothetical protein
MARPSEIKAVVDVLMQPSDDVKEVAKAAIAALDASRQDRTDYLVVRQCGKLADAYGPYATYAQAVKAIEGGKLPTLDGTRLFVVPVRHPSQAEAAMTKVDEPAMSPEAVALWEIARNGGQAAKTHSRRNRRRAA